MSGDDVLVQAAPQLLSATIGPSLLLLDRWTGATAILDHGAAVVWTSAVTGPATATQIAQAIASDLGGTVELHLPHVQRAIDGLLDKGLLIVGRPGLGKPVGGVVSERPPSQTSADRRRRIADALEQHPDAHTDVLRIGSCATTLVTFDGDLARSLRSHLEELVVEPAAAWDHQLAVIGSRRPGLPFRLLIDGVLQHRATSRHEVLRQVIFELNVLARTSTASSAIAVHGGAVERDGRVLLIAGASGAGKSTLTAALVQGGARYITDEVAVVDLPSGRLSPYPKPLDLAPESWRLIGIDPSAPDTMRGVIDAQKVPLPVHVLGTPSPGGTATALLVLDTSAKSAPPRRLRPRQDHAAARQFVRRTVPTTGRRPTCSRRRSTGPARSPSSAAGETRSPGASSLRRASSAEWTLHAPLEHSRRGRAAGREGIIGEGGGGEGSIKVYFSRGKELSGVSDGIAMVKRLLGLPGMNVLEVTRGRRRARGQGRDGRDDRVVPGVRGACPGAGPHHSFGA